MTRHEPLAPPVVRQPYEFTQRDFGLLAEHGAFDGHAKVELIEGVLIAVNAHYVRHARVHTLLFRALAEACDRHAEWSAWVEISVSIDDRNMPQPDILVSRGLPDEGPVPARLVALVVEIADTSAKIDLGAKASLYATAGIGEYWVADIEARQIHQLWEPRDGAYAKRRSVAFGETIDASTMPTLRVNTASL